MYVSSSRRSLQQSGRRLRRSERGQSTVLAAAVLAVAGVALYAIASFAGGLIDAAEARTAADAAALAGVGGGQAAADRLASLNGAHLVRFTRVGSDVIVTVRVGRAVATARAGTEATGSGTSGAAGARGSPPTRTSGFTAG